MATTTKLEPGQIVYSMERRRLGNTTLRTTAVIPVRIVQVYGAYVIASWNGNAPRRFPQRRVSSWKVNKPIMVRIRGRADWLRPATKAEAGQAHAEGQLHEGSYYIWIANQQ